LGTYIRFGKEPAFERDGRHGGGIERVMTKEVTISDEAVSKESL
jgi:hypothetical protein